MPLIMPTYFINTIAGCMKFRIELVKLLIHPGKHRCRTVSLSLKGQARVAL